MYIGVDLGSTNIKAALYDENMRLLARESVPVAYIRENGFVEFDAADYCENLVELLAEVMRSQDAKRSRRLPSPARPNLWWCWMARESR